MQLWGSQRGCGLYYRSSRKMFLIYYYYTKMADKDYSVEEKVALLREVERVYSEFNEHYKILKPTADAFRVFVSAMDTYEEIDQELLDTILSMAVEAVEEDIKTKISQKEYTLLKVWFWQIIWVVKWKQSGIDRLKSTLKELKRIMNVEKVEDTKWETIEKIMAEIKIYFNKK